MSLKKDIGRSNDRTPSGWAENNNSSCGFSALTQSETFGLSSSLHGGNNDRSHGQSSSELTCRNESSDDVASLANNTPSHRRGRNTTTQEEDDDGVQTTMSESTTTTVSVVSTNNNNTNNTSDEKTEITTTTVTTRKNYTMATTSSPSNNSNIIRPPSFAHRRQQSQMIIDEMTVNKLQFAALGRLYGRDQEISILQNCLRRITPQQAVIEQQQQQRQQQQQQERVAVELVFLSGYSGSGKTALANSLKRSTTVRTNRGLFVSGKFDIYLQGTPFGGIAEACKQICELLLSLPEKEEEREILKAGGGRLTEGANDEEEVLPDNSSRHTTEDIPKDSIKTSKRSQRQHSRHQPSAYLSTIRQALLEELATELPALVRIVPLLGDIVQQDSADHNTNAANNSSNNNEKEESQSLDTNNNSSTASLGQQNHKYKGTSAEARARTNSALQRFIRVVNSFFQPLVLVFDDLQSADQSSLDFIHSMVAEDTARRNIGEAQQSKNPTTTRQEEKSALMIIGCYRSNEVDDGHILAKTLSIIRRIEERGNNKNRTNKTFLVTELAVGDLNVGAIHLLLKDLLRIEDDNNRTLQLAQICHKKTNGNVFFLIQFLLTLQRQLLLEYNFGFMKWTWADENEIMTKTAATGNVVALLRNRIASLSEDYRLVMQIAASVGSNFHESTILLVWKDLRAEGAPEQREDEEASGQTMRSYLEKLCTEGYIAPSSHAAQEGNSVLEYKWSHDKIQEAVLTLLPGEEQNKFGRKVGHILVSRLSKKDLDVALFSAVNLLNEGSFPESMNEMERIESASLNLRAGKKAYKVSAFEAAAKYLAKGIQFLPSTCWTNNPSLALDLHSSAAEAQAFLGNIDLMDSCCNKVLSQDQLHTSDKLRVYHVKLESNADRGRMGESLELCRELLELYNFSFPRSKTQIKLKVAASLRQIKSLTKSMSEESVDSMPLCIDRKQREVIALLYKLGQYTYLLEHPIYPIVIFQEFQMILKHGLCDFAIPIFASVGMVLNGIVNDLQGGAKCGRQSVRILQRLQSKEIEPKAAFLVYGCLFSWIRPVQTMLKPVLEAYDHSFRMGSSHSGCWSIYHYMMLTFMSGMPLKAVEADCAAYSAQMEGLKMQHALLMCLHLRHTCLLLMDRLEDAADLESSFRELAMAPGMQKAQLAVSEMHKTLMFGYSVDCSAGADFNLKKGDRLQSLLPTKPLIMQETFLRCLSLFAATRKSKGRERRKYKKEALRVLGKMEDWVEQGNPNVRHYETLLQAENAVLKGKMHIARKNYEYAIAMASRNGFMNDAALSHLRYGQFLLFLSGDASSGSSQDDGKFHLKQSLNKFREWGANALSRAIESEYPDLESLPTSVITFSL